MDIQSHSLNQLLSPIESLREVILLILSNTPVRTIPSTYELTVGVSNNAGVKHYHTTKYLLPHRFSYSQLMFVRTCSDITNNLWVDLTTPFSHEMIRSSIDVKKLHHSNCGYKSGRHWQQKALTLPHWPVIVTRSIARQHWSATCLIYQGMPTT